MRQLKLGKKKQLTAVKKPVFRTMFLKRFLLFALIAGCVGFLGTSIATTLYGWIINSDIYNNLDLFCDTVKRGYERCDGDKEQFERLASFDAEVYSVGENELFFLIDGENGEVITPPQDDLLGMTVYSGFDKEDESYYESEDVYTCQDKEIIDAIRQAYSNVGYHERSLYLELVDFYLDGNNFVPGKIQIKLYDGPDGKVLEELDFTPKDKAGYEHIVIKEDGEHGYSYPSIWENDIPQELIAYMETIVQEREWWCEEGLMGGSGSAIGFIGSNECYNYQWFTIGEGNHRYCALGVSKYNFFEIWKTQLLVAYGVLLVVVLLLSWLTSYIAYTKQRGYYEMDQYRRDITNTMAHDLKSPLMVISGFAENLLEQNLDDKSKYYSKSIMENTEYMNQLIEKTLELSKVENADYKLHKESVNLRGLSDELIKGYKSKLEKNGLEIQITGESTVNADKMCMMQVLDNLIGNAVKYAIEGSIIEIRMDKQCHEISNASAMDFDVDVKDLVKPFVKGDNSRSGKQGSGIGLTIAKNLCQQHGYELKVECTDGIFVARMEW